MVLLLTGRIMALGLRVWGSRFKFEGLWFRVY